MKKIKYITGIWILLLLIGIVSCNDEDFLKEKPSTFYTVDNAFSTSAQVDQVLVSIYSHLRDLWANPNEQGWIFVFRGNGTDMFDVASIRKGNTFNNYGLINPDHGNFYENYTTWYYVISRANLALYAAELPQIAWSSPAEKAYADGKASEATAAFAKSITFANKVIDGGTYSLINSRFGTRKSLSTISFPIYQAGNTATPVDTLKQNTNYYWDMFQEGNVNYQDGNTESIWTMQVDYAAYKAEDKSSKLPYSRTYGADFRDGVKNHLTGT